MGRFTVETVPPRVAVHYVGLSKRALMSNQPDRRDSRIVEKALAVIRIRLQS